MDEQANNMIKYESRTLPDGKKKRGYFCPICSAHTAARALLERHIKAKHKDQFRPAELEDALPIVWEAIEMRPPILDHDTLMRLGQAIVEACHFTLEEQKSTKQKRLQIVSPTPLVCPLCGKALAADQRLPDKLQDLSSGEKRKFCRAH